MGFIEIETFQVLGTDYGVLSNCKTQVKKKHKAVEYEKGIQAEIIFITGLNME